MNSNFNRQFILLDFKLLEDKRFLAFLSSSEFATYLVLRRHIWRSAESHFMGLHELYQQQRLLACSLGREAIAKATGIDPDNISRHLTNLVQKKVIRRLRTGRQNIYVLGEWIDVYDDGSYRVEWFHLEGQYGISKTDLTESVRSDVTTPSDQTRRFASGQTRRSASDSNNKENRERITVNGVKHAAPKDSTANGIALLKQMPDLVQPPEKTDFVADFILDQLSDAQSQRFYRLVAAKVREDVIRQNLAEIAQDGGAKNPARVFTSRIKLYAVAQAKKGIGKDWHPQPREP